MIKGPFMAFGEVLFDVIDGQKRLGGAPLNFSYYLKKAGGDPYVVSSVGNDNLGKQLLESVRKLGLDTTHIALNDYPTGRTNVTFSGENPHFEVVRGSAWEKIDFSDFDLTRSSSGIYVGTFARVSRQNKELMDKILDYFGGKKIFADLNLRPGFYDKESVFELLKRATHLKINSGEAEKLKMMGFVNGPDYEQIARNLIQTYGLDACCITLGKDGAIGGDNDGVKRVSGIEVGNFRDSVGCGDAFAATWFASLLKGEDMLTSLTEANKVAAKVASHHGAIKKN